MQHDNVDPATPLPRAASALRNCSKKSGRECNGSGTSTAHAGQSLAQLLESCDFEKEPVKLTAKQKTKAEATQQIHNLTRQHADIQGAIGGSKRAQLGFRSTSDGR